MALGLNASSSVLRLRLITTVPGLPPPAFSSDFCSLGSRLHALNCSLASDATRVLDRQSRHKYDGLGSSWLDEAQKFRDQVSFMKDCVRQDMQDTGIKAVETGAKEDMQDTGIIAVETGAKDSLKGTDVGQKVMEYSSLEGKKNIVLSTVTPVNSNLSQGIMHEFFPSNHGEVCHNMPSNVEVLTASQNQLFLEDDSCFHHRRNCGTFEGKQLDNAGVPQLRSQNLSPSEYAYAAMDSGSQNLSPLECAYAAMDARTMMMEDFPISNNGGLCNASGVQENTTSSSRDLTEDPYCIQGRHRSKLKVGNNRLGSKEPLHHPSKVNKKGFDSANGASQMTFPRQPLDYDEKGTWSKPQTADLVGRTPKADHFPELQEVADNMLAHSTSVETKKEVSKNAEEAKLVCSVEDVLIVDNLATARTVIDLLRGDYNHLIQACDTEVADIDVKRESPVGHGKVTCFSIYCGPEADFGDGKTCIWVDVMDSCKEVIDAFKEYFEDPSIKKVWHNYSFDKHVLGNHGIRADGFYADTMHLARLWNSGRKGLEGGYSLESLTSDAKVMNGARTWDVQRIIKKTSMKDIFGVNKLKKDGTEGKIKVVPSVVELQRSESSRERWICYSAGDAISTWRLWESLHEKLRKTKWFFLGVVRGTMYDFYERFWVRFGVLLAQMESEGMLVDRKYLAEIEKVASKEREVSISRFRKWAAKYCPEAQHINVTSDSQLRQLLFGGTKGIQPERIFSVPNVDGYIEEGKKVPKKCRSITIRGIGKDIPVDLYTSSGLPAVSMQALKAMAGKISIDYSGLEEESEELVPPDSYENMVLTSAGVEGGRGNGDNEEEDLSIYGTAYDAFKGGEEGKEACKAIAAICEVSAIDTLISSFIQPLQGGDILGQDGRVHCSLNINTETGRLSARRPNLQNQPALEKDRYKIRQAFIASPGNSLIVADYGQLELRLLAHLSNCKSMLQAFEVGGDFHSRTAMNMYDHIRKAVESGEVILEWEPKPGEDAPPAPLLKDVYAAERRKAKMLNFSIAYGKTAKGLAKDWKVSLEEAQKTVDLWYRDRHEVREWQEKRKNDAQQRQCVHTFLGRARHFPDVKSASHFMKGHIDRAAINTPVQGSAADVAMLAMLEIAGNAKLKELGWKLLLQVHDEMILEGPSDSAEIAKDLVVKAMSHPFEGKNILSVELAVDAKYAESWYAAK